MRLAKTVARRKTDRRAFIPITAADDGTAAPIDYHGSAHIHSLCGAIGLISFPVDVSEIKAGTVVNVKRID